MQNLANCGERAIVFSAFESENVFQQKKAPPFCGGAGQSSEPKKEKSRRKPTFSLCNSQLFHGANVEQASEEIEDGFESANKEISAGRNLLFCSAVIHGALTNIAKSAGASADAVEDRLESFNNFVHNILFLLYRFEVIILR